MRRRGAELSLTQLLPQQPPMLLLDRVIAAEATQLWAQIELCPESVFAEPQGVPGNIALEYLAQAAAALFGVVGSDTDAVTQASPGMLVACNQLTSAAYFPVPSTLLAWVQFASPAPGTQGGLLRVRGEIALQDEATLGATEPRQLRKDWPSEPIAKANLSVYLPAPGTALQSMIKGPP